jgi:hypothetical protein
MKTEQLKKLIACCSAILGIVAFAMMFMVAVTTSGDNPVTYKGYELAFGKELTNVSILGQTSKAKIVFSFGTTLAYVLPLCSAVLFILCALGKNKGVKFLLGCVAFGLYVAAIILLVNVRKMSIVEGTTSGWISGQSKNDFTGFDMGIGLILGIVFSALGACTAGTYTCLNLLKK